MYSCTLCEYNTNYKSNYERHIKSKKHLLQTNELNKKNNLIETNIQKNKLIETNIQTNVMDLSKYYICFLLGYMFGINSCLIIIYIEPITNFILDNSLILDILGTYSK